MAFSGKSFTNHFPYCWGNRNDYRSYFKIRSCKTNGIYDFVFGALAAIAAMNTGEGRRSSRKYKWSLKLHESHEEAAETFAILSYILGGISLLGLWASFKQKSFSSIISIATLIFAFVVLFFAKQTGTTGGEIRHTEIRSGNNIPASENKNAEEDQDD